MLRFNLFSFILGLFIISNTYAQSPYDEIQKFPKEIIVEHGISKIIGWEYAVNDTIAEIDTTTIKPFKQTEEIYDSLGRLVSKENFWPYSDDDPLKRLFFYDDQNRIVKYQEFYGLSLSVTETFFYDKNNNLQSWSASFEKKKKRNFLEIVAYDSLSSPVKMSVKVGKKLKAEHYIENTYNDDQQRILEICHDNKKHLVDSVTYVYPQESDTVYIKKIYEGKHKYLIALQAYIDRTDGTQLYRNEEYLHNKFMGVTYHIFDKTKGMIKERSIHHYPELNFTKKYIYDDLNLIKEKQVFKNKKHPVALVKYEIILVE